MSDNDDEEYEYDYGSDNEEYDYGSDGGNDGGNDGGLADELIEIENAFYEGDDCKNESPNKAIELFEKVVLMETEKVGDQVKWRFKALQSLVSLYFSSEQYQLMLDRYRSMLSYMTSVTRNECTDAINNVIDSISSAPIASSSSSSSSKQHQISNELCYDVLSQVYEITLVALKNSNNERLWFNTNHKLAKLYLEARKFEDVERLITILKQSCQAADGSEDISKGSYLLEVYCLEIQLCSITMNSTRMRQIYPKTISMKNAVVADPRIMGIIREEGGKMHMAEGNWDAAYNELYESFRNYQEAGNVRAKDLLKYVVLASMLALSDINPFAAREAKVYADDKEIVAMSDLRQSLEANDLASFEKTLRNKSNRIADEPFLMTYIQPLRRRMHEQVLISLTRPYQKLHMSYLSRELSLTDDEIERLLVDMILDERLSAQIDQINGCLILKGTSTDSITDKKLKSIGKWCDNLIGISDSFGSEKY